MIDNVCLPHFSIIYVTLNHRSSPDVLDRTKVLTWLPRTSMWLPAAEWSPSGDCRPEKLHVRRGRWQLPKTHFFIQMSTELAKQKPPFFSASIIGNSSWNFPTWVKALKSLNYLTTFPSLPHAGILRASQHSQSKKNEFQQYLGCVLTFPN